MRRGRAKGRELSAETTASTKAPLWKKVWCVPPAERNERGCNCSEEAGVVGKTRACRGLRDL